MENQLSINAKIDMKKLSKVLAIQHFRDPLFMVMLCIGLYLISDYFPYFFGDQVGEEIYSYQQLILGMSLIIPVPVLYALQVLIFKKKFAHPISYLIDCKGVYMISNGLEEQLDWLDIKQVTEMRDWVLVQRNNNKVNYIPKSEMTVSELSQLKQMIQVVPSVKTKFKD